MTRHCRSLSHTLALAGLTLALTGALSTTVNAQQGQPDTQGVPALPAEANEPQGFLAEPEPLERLAVFMDRRVGKAESGNGFYISNKSPISGAGWITIGPGYRHWYKRDSVLVDGSAGVSWRGYKVAQARVELPRLLRSRLTLGTQYRWQDFRSVKWFGEGPDTVDTNETRYHLRSQNVIGYATVRPVRWFSVNSQLGWLSPSIRSSVAPSPTYVHGEVSMVADTRDFPNHPTRGGLLRVAASRFNDRDTGAYGFKRYESEIAGFVPLAESRVVVVLHGWLVTSETNPGQTVPFYLQPSLGGSHSLRAYSDYRFHDRHMLVANAELRVALMTHVDAVVFADGGNVASRLSALDLGKRSYGGGIRLHTRRTTFARFDVAHGSEGWRLSFGLSEPFHLSRLTRKTAPAPFVP